MRLIKCDYIVNSKFMPTNSQWEGFRPLNIALFFCKIIEFKTSFQKNMICWRLPMVTKSKYCSWIHGWYDNWRISNPATVSIILVIIIDIVYVSKVLSNVFFKLIFMYSEALLGIWRRGWLKQNHKTGVSHDHFNNEYRDN